MEKAQYILLHNLSNLFPMKTLKLACLLMGTLTVTLSLSVVWRLKIPFYSQGLKPFYGMAIMISLSWLPRDVEGGCREGL